MAERMLPILNLTPPVTDSHGDPVACGRQLNEAVERLETLLLNGLRHGFFKISMTCQITTGGKRQLIIRAGKSYQFTIRENEIPH
jgi:hypothetical protein